MEPNEAERQDLADRVTAERIQRYGTRIAAYAAAGINSATWTKVEQGQPVSERSLIAVVKHLWPETGGDWRRLSPPLGGGQPWSDQLLNLIEQAPLSEEARRQILAILEGESPPPQSPDTGERGVS